MNRIVPVLVVFLVLAGAAAGYYYWLQGRASPAAPSAPVIAVPARSIPPSTAPVATPQIRHPVESLPAAKPLPSLEQSDAAILAALQDLLGSKALGLLLTDQIIHRIVTTVDALPRKQVPASVRPVKPLESPFLATGAQGDVAIAPGNAARYAPYVALARSMDVSRLLYLYRRF